MTASEADTRRAQYEAAVAVALGGGSFEKVLCERTAEGLMTLPLYTAPTADALIATEQPLLSTGRASERPWWVVQSVDLDRLGSSASATMRAELEQGVEAFLVRGNEPQVRGLSQEAAFSCPVLVDAGSQSLAVAETWRQSGASRVSSLQDLSYAVAGGADLKALVAQGVAAVSQRVVDGADDRPDFDFVVDATRPHEAMGHGGLELGYALAGLVELLRHLEPGCSASGLLRATAVMVTPGTDTFAAVAKLRALRLGYQRLCRATEVWDAPALRVVGRVSARAQARTDCGSNHLRATLEVFGLAVAGADLIVGRAFDELSGESELGRRMAKNTQLVLRDESHLGFFPDAAAGSHYLEQRTMELARLGWEEMQRIEREGGLSVALRGGFGERCRAARGALEKDLRSRKKLRVGVGDFAPVGEVMPALAVESPESDALLAAARETQPFEALRERAAGIAGGPRVTLVLLGDHADYRGREGFARRFFEAGGFRVRTLLASELDPQPDLDPVLVVCSNDERYAESAASVVALVARPGRRVLLAGKPGALAEGLHAAGLSGAIFLGCDAIAELSLCLDATQGAK